jgi:hypothetical protein
LRPEIVTCNAALDGTLNGFFDVMVAASQVKSADLVPTIADTVIRIVLLVLSMDFTV